MTPPETLRHVAAAVILLEAAIFYAAPGWRGSSYWFSVTVAPQFPATAAAQRLLRLYRLAVAAAALAAIALNFAAPAPLPTGGLLGLPLHLAAFVWARRASLPHAIPAPAVRKAQLGAPEPSAWWLFHAAVPLALLAAIALYLAIHYEAIPDRLPFHWNARGLPDRWGPKSLVRVLRVPATGAAACLSVGLSLYGLLWQARGGRRKRATVQFLLAGACWLVGLLFGWISLHPYPLGFDLGRSFLVFALLPLPAAALLIYLRPGEDDGSAVPTSDAAWKGGLLYYAPEDPALFVERRFGYGFDVNFARPLAWLIVGLAILPAPLWMLSP